MLRVAILTLAFASAASVTAAGENVQRMSGEDVAVLEGALRDHCLSDNLWEVVLSDAPETRLTQPVLPDPQLERDYGAQFEARAKERTLWPRTSPCRNFPVVSGAGIEAFFAKDNRIPVGWEGFEDTFGARAYLAISRPAYSADRQRAVVTFGIHSGAMCGGRPWVIELVRTINGWRILRSFS